MTRLTCPDVTLQQGTSGADEYRTRRPDINASEH